MSREVSFGLGGTQPSGEQEHLLGTEGCFKHLTVGAEAPQQVASNMQVYAIWVKNEAGKALTPGEIVHWDTGTTYGPGKAVLDEAAADTDVAAGVVDPHLPSAGVADNKHFWLIVKGPCQFLFTTGTTITIGDVLALGGAGRVIKYDAAGSDTTTGNRDRCGRTLESVDTAIASDTLFNGYADFRF